MRTNYPSVNSKFETSLRTIHLDLRSTVPELFGDLDFGARPRRMILELGSRTRLTRERIVLSIRWQAAKCKLRGQIG